MNIIYINIYIYICVCRLHVSSQTDADKVKFAIILSQGFAEINCFGGGGVLSIIQIQIV